MKNAFVTGGTGFIGINLIKLLLEQQWQVTALYRNGSDRSALQNLSIMWKKGTLDDSSSLVNIIPDDTDVVFHLAGDTNMWSQRNDRQTRTNVQGTRHMVEAAALNRVLTFIHTSSVAAWGNVSGAVTEQTEQRGGESWINYERTKWAGEREALKGTEHGMKVVILNPANVVGPYDRNNWGRLFTALRDDELPFIANGCVSVAHVREVAHAHLAAVNRAQSGERYILGGDHHMFSDFVRCINDVSGADNMPHLIPTPLFRGYARISSFIASLLDHEPALTPELAYLMTRRDVKYLSSKAEKALGYSIPPMQHSVQDCYRWLKAERAL